jgi:hypothetical protein
MALRCDNNAMGYYMYRETDVMVNASTDDKDIRIITVITAELKSGG